VASPATMRDHDRSHASDIDAHVMRQCVTMASQHRSWIISRARRGDDRVRGLRAGGDDYLVKPFPSSNCWRDRAWDGAATPCQGDRPAHRRPRGRRMSRNASRRGKAILLSSSGIQLLEYLVRNQGRVVSRAMLLQHVWDLIRSFNEYYRRLCRARASQGRRPAGLSAGSLRFAASGTVSVLLTKALTSSTFKLALIAIGTFRHDRVGHFQLRLPVHVLLWSQPV